MNLNCDPLRDIICNSVYLSVYAHLLFSLFRINPRHASVLLAWCVPPPTADSPRLKVAENLVGIFGTLQSRTFRQLPAWTQNVPSDLCGKSAKIACVCVCVSQRNPRNGCKVRMKGLRYIPEDSTKILPWARMVLRKQ